MHRRLRHSWPEIGSCAISDDDDDAGDEAFVSQKILGGGESYDCVLTPDDEGFVREVFGFGDEVVFRIPRGGERPDSLRRGWVCLFSYPFLLGLRFSFPTFIQDFFRYYHLSPGQILPHAWRILLSINALLEDYGWELSIDDVGGHYTVRPVGPGRFTLRTVEGSEGLITLAGGSNDRGWTHQYIFVRVDTLGPGVDYLFDSWRKDVPKVTCSAGEVDVIDKICALPVDKRTYPGVLGARTRRAGLGSGEEEEEEEEERGSSPDMSLEVGKSRRLSTKELAERVKRRKTASVGDPGLDQPVPISIAFDTFVSKLRTKSSAKPRSGCHLSESFGKSGKMPLLPLEQLLFPNVESCLNERAAVDVCGDLSASLFQISLHFGRLLESVSKEKQVLGEKVKATEGRVASLTARLDVANRRLKDQEARLEEALSDKALVMAELDAVKEENARLHEKMEATTEENAGLREKLKAKKELLQEASGYYSWLARVECMEEYARGEHTTWNVAEERASLNETYKDRPKFADSDDDEDQYMGETDHGDRCSLMTRVRGGVLQLTQVVDPVEGQGVSPGDVQAEGDVGAELAEEDVVEGR
ncbi:hypothetical protein RND81_05G041400 [Saponaria officinalis]|uniref:Uncharacterized protein n=1 Tax=Saponaria officinalis TaxID=3572 RepID=A0AAW1KSG5_SAPOF